VLTYVLRRILLMVPTLVGITLLLFVVMQLAPGDPATVKFGDSGGAGMTQSAGVEDAITKFRQKYNLDKPLLTQYWLWISKVVVLDFGTEFNRPNIHIMDELWRRMAVTLSITGVSVFLIYLLAIPLGIMSAVRQGTTVDKATTMFLFLLYSLPTFWAGLMLIIIFGQTGLGLLPVLGLHDKDAATMTDWEYIVDMAKHLILPVVTFTYGGLAYLSRQMRVGMLETIHQDYIRTARAKGLSERAVIYRHALRNSVIPVITVFASILPILIGGSLIVEVVFGIPGMGLYAFEALLKRDYPVVMATVTMSAFMTLLGFLLSDVLYAVVDPRISYD
jgi:peptide/nickel transport system permease protein